MQNTENLKIGILRSFNPNKTSREDHTDRKDIVNGLITSFDMDIDKNQRGWQLLNDTQPHEFVELAIQVIPVIIPLVAEVLRWTLKRKRIGKAELEIRGQRIVLEGDMTYDEVQKLIKEIMGKSLEDTKNN